jgi:hypothetical protein
MKECVTWHSLICFVTFVHMMQNVLIQHTFPLLSSITLTTRDVWTSKLFILNCTITLSIVWADKLL